MEIYNYIPQVIIATCIVGIIYFCTGDNNSRIDNRKNW